MIELIHTDLPLPVAPAINRWGIEATSPTITLPDIFFPNAIVSRLLAERNSSVSTIYRIETVSILRLGTSIPTAALLGIGASILTPAVARLKAISSARPVILLIFTPAEG